MSEQQLAAQRLAQSIARLHQAEQSASRALLAAECTLRNVASRHLTPEATGWLWR